MMIIVSSILFGKKPVVSPINRGKNCVNGIVDGSVDDDDVIDIIKCVVIALLMIAACQK